MTILFDIDDLSIKQAYNLLTSTVVPRPIAWVLTKNHNNLFNLAPFSFFNVFSGHPPVICVGIGNRDSGAKDTANNIQANREFVVHMVTESLAESMNQSSIHVSPDVSELDYLGLKTRPATKVNLRIIEESPVAMECRLQQIVNIEPTGIMIVATVCAVHVSSYAVLDTDRCHIDASKLQLIGRMESPGWYVRTTDRFQKSALQHTKK